MKRKATKKIKAANKKASAAVLKVEPGLTGVRRCLALVNDEAQDTEVRAEAVRSIQTASFSEPAFETVREDYNAALRKLAQDKEPSLRRQALAFLSQEGDTFAEKVLVDGLKNSNKELVPPATALDLLSYNPHSGVQTIARQIFAQSSDNGVKQNALRIMSRDPEARRTIQAALADRTQSAAVRKMSAAALHALDPDALQKWAGRAVQEGTDDKELLTTCLTALHAFGDPKTVTGNEALKKGLSKLGSKASGRVKKAARSVIKKYGL